MDTEAARVRRALWRAVNDAIAAGCRRSCERHATFVCECDSSWCTVGFDLPLAEYERLRALDGGVLAPGHGLAPAAAA